MENILEHEETQRLPMFIKTRSLSFRFKKKLRRATSLSVLPSRISIRQDDLPYSPPSPPARPSSEAGCDGRSLDRALSSRSSVDNTSATQLQHLKNTVGGASRGVSMVELVKTDCKVGIVVSGGADRGSRPQVAALTPGGAAQRSDAVCVGDRIRAVNGTATEGLLHHEVLELLRGTEPRVQLELEYDMPESVVSSESVCACPRVIQVMVEKEQGSFGFTVRGGTCQEEPSRSRPLTITHVRPGGPTDREGTVKPGDRLLAVDGVRLTHASLSEAHRALTSVQRQAVLTVEYDVSVMEAVRAGPGPLLVELERPAGGLLGLALSAAGSAIVIESIRQASVAERVGALHVGDQVLAIDDVSLESLSASEASRLLQSCSGPLLRLEIVPVAARRASDAKRCKATLPPSLQTASSALSTSSCGSGSYNTLGSVYRRRQPGRPARKHRGHGDGSSAAGSRQEPGGGQYAAGGGGTTTLCHQESTTLSLLADSQGFGLALTSRSDGADGPSPPVVGHIEPGSPADRCGILHVGDRLLEVNHQPVDDMSADQASRLLADSRPRATITVEFDVADAVVPSSGTFLVKLVKRGPSLGLTVSAPKCRQLGETLIVADVEPGSVAHRNGTIEPGDRLLGIDGLAVDRLTVQQATERLHAATDIVSLRIQKDNLWADAPDSSRVVFTVELKRHGGPLGLTVSGTEEPFDPIFISGLTDGGLAERTGALHVGDRVLAINGTSLRGRPLSEAIQLLQTSGDEVRLKVAKAATNRRGSLSSASLSASGGREPPRPPGSALASVDSAVESWDSAAAAAAELPRLRLAPSGSGSGSGSGHGSDSIDGAKLGNDSAGERDSGGAGGERWESSSQRLAAGLPPTGQEDDTEAEDDWNKVLSDLEEVESFRRDCEDHRLDEGVSRRPAGSGGGGGSVSGGRAVSVKPPRLPNWTTDKCSSGGGGGGATTVCHQSESELAGRRLAGAASGRPPRDEAARGAASAPEFRLPGSYTALSRDSRHLVPVQIHRVTLFKDAVYEDFGFSLSNALYEKGVYVNRVKPGGPADKSGILRPHDRILQVNQTPTSEHDCCHIVPLIASVGDRLDLVVARNPLTDQQPQLEDEPGRHPWVEEDDKLTDSADQSVPAELAKHVL